MIPRQIIYRIFGLFFVLFATFTECKEIHKLMTEDEILKIFHTTPDSAVPKYEVVPIEHSLYKRSTPKDFRLKFKAFDKDVDIYLNPNEGILYGDDTPVWIAEHSRGMQYRRLKDGIMKEMLGIYQSVHGRAALIVSARENENLKFDGTVDDLTIVPIPYRLQYEIDGKDKKKRHLPSSSRSMKRTEYHIVFRSNAGINQTNTAQQLHKPTLENSEHFSNQIAVTRSKRADKEVVFPTILVTTDFNVPVNSQDDSEYYDQIIYQLAFWNAVDLRYRHLSNPKVRLRIAGLIIGSDRKATPYLNNNMADGEVELYPAIMDMRNYWAKWRSHNFPSESYHIVTTATNLNLFKISRSGEKTHYGGLTRVSSFCSEHGNQVLPSVIFKDNLAFGAINVAVHEVAHVLGAYHDGDINKNCKADDGYLMTPIISVTQNNPIWSKCSLKRLSHVLRHKSCADQPKDYYPPGKPMGKILPGTLKTAQQQCQARGFDYACDTTPEICKILKCYNSGFHGFFTTLMKCQDSNSAAEGTECAPGRVCLDGECRPMQSSENY